MNIYFLEECLILLNDMMIHFISQRFNLLYSTNLMTFVRFIYKINPNSHLNLFVPIYYKKYYHWIKIFEIILIMYLLNLHRTWFFWCFIYKLTYFLIILKILTIIKDFRRFLRRWCIEPLCWLFLIWIGRSLWKIKELRLLRMFSTLTFLWI